MFPNLCPVVYWTKWCISKIYKEHYDLQKKTSSISPPDYQCCSYELWINQVNLRSRCVWSQAVEECRLCASGPVMALWSSTVTFEPLNYRAVQMQIPLWKVSSNHLENLADSHAFNLGASAAVLGTSFCLGSFITWIMLFYCCPW